MLQRVTARSFSTCVRSFSVSSSSSISSSFLNVNFSLSRSLATAASTTTSKNAPIVSRPAAAVFKSAQKDSGKDTVDRVGTELSEFSSAYDEVDTLRFVASNPTLKPEEKKAKFAELFPKLEFHPVTVEILNYYLCTGQGNKIKDLAADYNKLLTFHRNEVTAIVTTAEKLSPAQLSKVQAVIKNQVAPGEKLVLEQKIEPSILGGLLIQIGGKSVDLTVSSQIKKIDQAIRSI